jgi:hypothetical protein
LSVVIELVETAQAAIAPPQLEALQGALLPLFKYEMLVESRILALACLARLARVTCTKPVPDDLIEIIASEIDEEVDENDGGDSDHIWHAWRDAAALGRGAARATADMLASAPAVLASADARLQNLVDVDGFCESEAALAEICKIMDAVAMTAECAASDAGCANALLEPLTKCALPVLAMHSVRDDDRHPMRLHNASCVTARDFAVRTLAALVNAVAKADRAGITDVVALILCDIVHSHGVDDEMVNRRAQIAWCHDSARAKKKKKCSILLCSCCS